MNAKAIFCTVVALCAAVGSVWAQKTPKPMCLTTKATSLVDVEEVFEAMGIKIYSFDLSQTARTPYKMEVYVDSHRGDSVETVVAIPIKRNLKYVADFPAKDHQQMREQYNLKKNEQVFSRIEELKFYLLPKNDSVVKLRVHMPTYGTMTRELKLNQVVAPEYSTYLYRDRPFKLVPMVVGEKTPLVLYGSGWYDPKANIVRMCGESQIDPDLSKNDILKNLPQYYVVGVRFVAIKE